MSSALLQLDRAFVDFNFCEVLDPTLNPGNGPTQAGLFALVSKARQGDRAATLEFATTMDWTLREVTLNWVCRRAVVIAIPRGAKSLPDASRRRFPASR